MKSFSNHFNGSSIYIILVIGMLWGLGACTSINNFTSRLTPSPHEHYAKQLEQSGLTKTEMVRAWLRAADPTQHDSIIVSLPFRETGYFASTETQARFYRFDVKAGQVLTLTSLVKAPKETQVFADLFILEAEGWKKKEHADTSLTLTYEFTAPGTCLIRLQSELLVNVFYSITLSVTPVLLNPVKGANNKSIGSFYGDPRDGGKRKHEGIDIFAPKGTPVVAPTGGVITRVAMGGLGGKTIWMNDTKRGHSYYFAHLDSQYVRQGIRVKQGDTLGTVGNTGNAKTTPAHLHFGVYQRNAIDPIAYIRTMEKLVNELAPDKLFQSIVSRVKPKQTFLYTGPSATSIIQQPLIRDGYVKVIAQTNDWYRVLTADQAEGFVEKRNVLPAEKGNKIILRKPVWLLTSASPVAVPVILLETQTLQGLASHQQYRYIKTEQGVYGWIDITSL